MSTHDPFDDELRSRLRASRSDTSADARADLDALKPRFRRARRRRQATVAAASLGTAVVVLLGAVALGGSGEQSVDVIDGPSTPTSTSTTTSTTSTTTSTIPDETTIVAPDPTLPTTTVPAPASDGGAIGSGGSGGSSDPVVTAPVTTVGTVTETLSSEGGTARVQWSPSSIVVVGTAPAAGWELEGVEQHDTTRVVVKFRRIDGGQGSGSATIDARVVDGRLEARD